MSAIAVGKERWVSRKLNICCPSPPQPSHSTHFRSGLPSSEPQTPEDRRGAILISSAGRIYLQPLGENRSRVPRVVDFSRCSISNVEKELAKKETRTLRDDKCVFRAVKNAGITSLHRDRSCSRAQRFDRFDPV